MKLEQMVKYSGKEYKVNLELHNEEEVNKETISLVNKTLWVSSRVLNEHYNVVYKVENRVDLTDKNSLVEYVKNIVRAANEKENLEQVKMLNDWNGDIDEEIEEVSHFWNNGRSLIDIAKELNGLTVVDKKNNISFKIDEKGKVEGNNFTIQTVSASELLEDVKIHEYKLEPVSTEEALENISKIGEITRETGRTVGEALKSINQRLEDSIEVAKAIDGKGTDEIDFLLQLIKKVSNKTGTDYKLIQEIIELVSDKIDETSQ
ncbi:hypothetical protein [Priestia megaterium]|uniref:hypothetical protein n=1 Tax=Priestia megaterium TaxID=1404 RepID=UPI003CC5834C